MPTPSHEAHPQQDRRDRTPPVGPFVIDPHPDAPPDFPPGSHTDPTTTTTPQQWGAPADPPSPHDAAASLSTPHIATLAQARRGFLALLAAHAVIDIYPIFFTSLMLVLRERLALTEWQVAAVFMATPIFSGLCQPILAWLTDKHDSRLAGPGGLALGALCIGSIGFAQDFWQLMALQIVGVIGTGMFHPIGTALAGQTGARVIASARKSRGNGRAAAIGVFIAAGMIGQSLGPIIATRTTEHLGMPALAWLIIPSLLIAIALHILIAKIPHRHHNHRAIRDAVPADEAILRRRTVGVLTIQNALRFTANVGMFVMFNVWADSVVRAGALANTAAEAAAVGGRTLAEQGANIAANLSTSMTIGMGIAVFLSGRLFRPGREHRPLLILSLIGAAAMAALAPVGDLVASTNNFSFLPMLPMYLCAALTPIGFFATFPLATSLSQRLLPGHTSLVSALMMGVGWSVSSLSTPLAMLFFGFTPLSAAAELPAWRINLGFYGFATLLILAGLLSLTLPRHLLAKAAADH
ncbi:MAG: MFS transporter [Phycisphaerales bacterium]